MSSTVSRNPPAWWQLALVSLLLSLASVACFSGALHADFIFFDDALVVTRNPRVTGGLDLAGVRWALTGVHAANWMPLTWISHQLDFSLFGSEPAGHHLTSILLHGAASGIMFLGLAMLTGRMWPAAMVAALFAVHPLRAESVVWVAERKDVLSAFWFAVLLVALARARSSGRGADRMLVTVCLILGVASKAMLVTVPGVMLLIALWRDGRLPSVRTVAPEVTIAGIVSVILIRAQHGSSVHSGAPFLQRLSNAVVGIKEYLELTVWPDALSVFHPARIDGRTPHEVVVAVALLGGITGLSIFAWRRDARAPLVGWIWFLGMLIPVSGIIPIGAHAIAERYTYLPHVGLFVAVVFGLDEIWPHGRRICAAAVAIALTLFFVRTITVVETWESNTTLSAAGLRAEPSNPVLLPVYGAGLLRAGAWGPAIERMEHAMAARRIFWSPAGSETPATQLGITLLEVPGRLDTAIHWLRKAVESNPRNCLARRGLSVGLARQGDLDGAIDEARLAVAVGKPVDDRDNHRNLASLLMGAGRAREALELLRAAPHSIQSDVADFRLRAAALTTNCAGAVSEGDALASALYRPTTAFIDEYLLALACVGDIRAVSVLETAPPSQSRARLIAELIVTLRANEPLPAETLAVLISNAPPLHGLENDRLAPMAMRPTDLASVLKLIDPSGRH